MVLGINRLMYVCMSLFTNFTLNFHLFIFFVLHECDILIDITLL